MWPARGDSLRVWAVLPFCLGTASEQIDLTQAINDSSLLTFPREWLCCASLTDFKLLLKHKPSELVKIQTSSRSSNGIILPPLQRPFISFLVGCFPILWHGATPHHCLHHRTCQFVSFNLSQILHLPSTNLWISYMLIQRFHTLIFVGLGFHAS